MMSGPFFIMLTLIKYTLKVLILYLLYKKGKKIVSDPDEGKNNED
jgi:mannose/fructose/N-acetylgalactosamine-specific phosphotransferase system component IID